jgi:RNA polymerase sigma-70 factor (ECF subfamily)
MQYQRAIAGSAPERPAAATASSDEALMALIGQGDQRALRALFLRHQLRVFRFLLRLVDDAATAEDLVSEVFIEVWRHAGRFEGRSQVSTWLLAIARHKSLSARRRRSSEPLDEDAAERIADPADDPEVALHKRQRGAVLLDCLKQLSPEHREVIDLVYYHACTIEEVAEIIRVPAGTVKTRMFYARRRLAEMMAARGVEHACA